MAGGNVDDGHHPLAAGKIFEQMLNWFFSATTDLITVQL